MKKEPEKFHKRRCNDAANRAVADYAYSYNDKIKIALERMKKKKVVKFEVGYAREYRRGWNKCLEAVLKLIP